MPLVSSSIPNLINGVSQQPPALRLASQAEQVVNCMPSPVEGLKKRPACQHIAKLFSGSAGTGRPFVHVVDRDGAIQYLVIIQDNNIRVFGMDGSLKTVNTPDGTSYLDITGEPSSTFRVATVADTTFIVNREKTVTMDAGLSPVWGTKSMVFIKTAEYDTTYSIRVGGTTVTYTTAAAGGAAPNTNTIANNLATSLDTALGAGWTVTNSQYIVRITKDDGTDYTLSSSDSRTGSATIAIKGAVGSISDLPVIAEHGFLVRVQGSKASNNDDYFAKFEANSGSGFGPGKWRETVAPGIKYEFTATTMPHVLVRETNGTFTFKKYTWSGRVAGDATTAPEPSFVGSKIENINLYRNRLVLLADENVILSAANDYARFWPASAQTVIDSDPIDLSAGGNTVNFLVASLTLANALLLFSRHGQFRLDGGAAVGAPLTPNTATITAMTTFEMVDEVDPISVGRTTYFAIPRGEYTGVREFFLPDASGPAPISEEVTAAVPRYVPQNLCTLIATVSEEAIVAISKDTPKRVYLYKFLFQDDIKIQSAWSYWEVTGDKSVIGADFIDSDLYLVVEYNDGVYLEKVVTRPENVDSGAPFEMLLDRKVNEASCSVALTTPAGLDVQSTITLPYPINANSTMVVVGRYATPNTIQPGQIINIISQTATGGAGGNGTLVVRGDLTAAKFWVGESYQMLYEFSTPYLKEEPPGGGMAMVAGPKLQLRTWTMIFDQSSTFQLNITPRNRDTYSYPYTGIEVGDQQVPLGTPGIRTGKFRVPVMTQNIDAGITITSTSPLPCRLQSAEWEGWYFSRARRL
jgi:hypothetical protein